MEFGFVGTPDMTQDHRERRGRIDGGALEPRRILVAVSAGIAAYKVPLLVRELIGAGHSVRCVMTPRARHFVSPLVLETLTGHPAGSELFSGSGDASASDAGAREEIDHIALADWADLVVVAPATADLMARMCAGMADDLVTSVLLATRAPLLLAPAMNVNMWEHPATQANLETLRARGARTVGPESGELACGWEGQGRMSEPTAIAAAASLALGSDSLAEEVVLVTAGGTREPIDAVRTITNRSSGRMGFAVAAEAARRGARVVLVAGTTSLSTPPGVARVDVGSALEMRDAVLEALPEATIVVKAAAVADFRPAHPQERKIKKESLEGGGLSLELVPNPDILAEVCRLTREAGSSRVVVGFAAESHDVLEAARRKIARKGCDLLVANDVSRSDAGFDVDTNAVHFVYPDGEVEDLPLLGKDEVAGHLLDRIAKLRDGRR
jgi:phosphopantothenoylcysteine decarboxylase/phosphopantothenate--cysteine ligase